MQDSHEIWEGMTEEQKREGLQGALEQLARCFSHVVSIGGKHTIKSDPVSVADNATSGDSHAKL